jgi:AcrR family transcriptional regulator
MPSTKVPSPRWQRRPAARPEEILEAALTVFGERGFARARLEDVARHAGVSKGTVYLYFDSKDTLFREMVRAIKGRAFAEAEEYIEKSKGSARETLTGVMHMMWFHMSDPRQAMISRLVQSEIGSFPELARFYFEEVTLRGRRLLERILARGVANGEFRPEQARFAARAIPAMSLMLSGLHCFFSKYDPEPQRPEALAEGVLDLVLNGVLAHGPETGR